MKEGELSWCHSWSEVASDVRVTQWISEEHQAGEPWCSRLLLIHRAKGHISPCYRTTSVSTANQVQLLVVIEHVELPGTSADRGHYYQHNSPAKYSYTVRHGIRSTMQAD